MSIEDTTLPFKLPADWRSTFVGNEFFLTLGKMLDADKNVGVPKPYLGNKSVRWGRIDINDLSLIKLTPSDLHRYRLADGDLLVCEGGDVGRSAIWSGQLEECYFQKALHRVRSRGGYSAVLLRYLLEFYSKTGFLLNFATQTSIAHLPKDKFEVMPLPKPSMGEQKAIAGALSDADTLIDELERLIAKKRLIKQGAMQELLTGKRRLPGFSGKWETKPLGDVALVVMGQSPSSATYNTSGRGLPLIQGAADVRARKTIKRIFTTEITKLGKLGDIILTVRAPVGEVSKAEFDLCLGRGVCAVRTDDEFLYHALIHAEGTWSALSKGSTFDSVNSDEVRGFEIRYPLDCKERKSIANVLTDMSSEIQALETRLEKARAIKEGMMQNLLTGRIRLV